MSSSSEPLSPRRPVPAAGAISLRVRYCECDPMGVAHHGAYIPWLEMGRTELLRESGVAYADLEREGVFLAIVKLEVSYKRPAYYDDVLDVRTRVVGGPSASRVKIRHEYEVFRQADGGEAAGVGASEGQIAGPGALTQRRIPGELLMTGSSLLACIDRSGRPRALPDWLVTSA